MSLRIEKNLDDNLILYRFVNEQELGDLVKNNALLRFTKTEMQYDQEEGFAFENQIERAKETVFIDDEELIKEAIEKIIDFIDKDECKWQNELSEINQKAIDSGDNECPGRKLIRKICDLLKIECRAEILSKWDDANYGIVTDIETLRDYLDDLECRPNLMHENDIKEIGDHCINCSSLCCFWISSDGSVSRKSWKLLKNKVAAIKVSVGDLKAYLKNLNQKEHDEKRVFYLCKVEYDNNPNYLYDEDNFELPIEIALFKFLPKDKEIVSEMLKILKYKKTDFEKEKEMRIIAMNKSLERMEEMNLFLPYEKKLNKEMLVSPRLWCFKRRKIESMIRQLDDTLVPKKEPSICSRILNFFKGIGKTK